MSLYRLPKMQLKSTIDITTTYLKWSFVIQCSFVGDTMTLEMVIRKELVSFKESNRFAI